MTLQRLHQLHRNNINTIIHSPLSEISGSLGDLGTLMPILTALTVTRSISLVPTLLVTGIANILTGILFGIPLPVQPMKTIASVSIARNFTREETTSAGLFVASCVAFLSITGSLRWFSQAIPIPVVKGIQVGAGLSLVISAGSNMLQPLGWVTPSRSDNLIWAIVAFLLLLAGNRFPRLPYALLVFLFGLLFTSITLRTSTPVHSPPVHHGSLLVLPTWYTFISSALSAGLGQLPLTTLNSIVAVSHLSSELLPSLPEPSPASLGISIAVMNLVGCWFGAMPACHGSGGLAGQYRFGARSGSSVIVLGSLKVLLGLLCNLFDFEDGAIGLLHQFPKSFLGIMVVAAGLELAKVGESLNVGARDLWEHAELNHSGRGAGDGEGTLLKKSREPEEKERRERWTVMLATVAGLLAFKNAAVGFGAGMLWHWAQKAQVPLTLPLTSRLHQTGIRRDSERTSLLDPGSSTESQEGRLV
ncbi:hypothetical protein M501DRAFT_971913 [Patellaria atrata CBS 101060]|uniref:Sulfate transporter n=1 Tax=Patellaria atrata CBS 101060 TaxID=1346257 RepID=A0A9P4SCB7_9PEZI|nr:hypothetical protein M501DRAFT_971913 [Patellaria atrata CBS 101060]